MEKETNINWPNSQMPKENGNKHNKILLVLGVLAILTILIVGIQYLFDQKQNVPENKTLVADQFVDWQTYRNEEYGVEFSYPITLLNDKGPLIQVIKGDAGEMLAGIFWFDSGTVLQFSATTNDYSVGKGAQASFTKGYVFKNGNYYLNDKYGNQSAEPVFPSEIIRTEGGQEILIFYNKEVDERADYPETPVKAITNIPNAKSDAIGFSMVNLENKEYQPSESDIQILKNILSTFKFIE